MVGDRRIHQNYIPSNLIPFSEGEMIGVPNSEGWMICTDKLRFDRASPRRVLSSLRLWMICLEKMRKTDSKEPIALIRGKSRLKISDPTPLKEMKSASTAKNGWLPNTQN